MEGGGVFLPTAGPIQPPQGPPVTPLGVARPPPMIAGHKASAVSSGAAAHTATKVQPPALDAAATAGVAATKGGGTAPHAALPQHIPPSDRTIAFDAVRAEAKKPEYEAPGQQTPAEILAQDYVEDVVADMCGEPRQYAHMTVRVGLHSYMVEQRGDKMRVLGHNANEPEVMAEVLKKVEKKEAKNAQNGQRIFDPATLAACMTNVKDPAKVRGIKPDEVLGAIEIGRQALYQSQFVDALHNVVDNPEKYVETEFGRFRGIKPHEKGPGFVSTMKAFKQNPKKHVQTAFARWKTSHVAKRQLAKDSPGVPQDPIVPEDVHEAFEIIIHDVYQRLTEQEAPQQTAEVTPSDQLAADEDTVTDLAATPPGTPPQPAAAPHIAPIDTKKIEGIASGGVVRFYKADADPTSRMSITECFGNYHVLENGRTVFGCLTTEGAFLSRKYGIPEDAPDNPFRTATEYTNPSLAELNHQFKTAKRTVAGWVQQSVTEGLANQGPNVQAMYAVLKEKYKPGTPEYDALIATGNATLVEETPVVGRDIYWATDPGGEGVNMLGQLLMQIRGELQPGLRQHVIKPGIQQWY